MPKCPHCQRAVSISGIKPSFECPSCKKPLASNITIALVICIAGWVLLMPTIATLVAPHLCGKSGLCFGLTDALIGAAIFFPLFLVLLRVRAKE